MSRILVLFFGVLFILAAVFRADFVLMILYFLLGAFVISDWWSRKALAAVTITRYYNRNAFFGEKIPVIIELENKSFLPVVWVYARETVPMELAVEGKTQKVLYLAPKSKITLNYQLDGRRRGYYSIGPMSLFSGDLFGFTEQQMLTLPEDHFTVFPKIIPLTNIQIPSNSPLGTLKHHLPIHADPTRIRGKRAYIEGDSFRQIDWKATAITNQLQVKIFEPSISLQTMIFLNLNRQEYPFKHWSPATELGIIVASSMSNWLIRARQSVGLASNGIDSMRSGDQQIVVPVRSGQGHLMRILETLARLQVGETIPLIELLLREYVQLTWGSSIIIITNRVNDDLFDCIFQVRRRGLSPVLILCGYVNDYMMIKEKAGHFGIPLCNVVTEKDLDIWR